MDQALNSKAALAETNFWTETRVDSDAWLTRNRFALMLGLFILSFFPSVLFGTQTFFFRDYGVFGYPLASYYRDCFWRGELPVWNSLSNCGLPYLAQWNTLTLYPLSLIYLVFPLPWSLSFFCLGHLFLAGLGMYVLAHSWTNDRLAAAIAGFAFAFNGLTLNCLMWPNNIAALGWMPWVVWAVSRGWQQGGRALLVGVLVSTMQMLSGAPEIILFTWLIIGVLWVAGMFTENTPRFTLLSRALIMIALTGALAAVQLLPFLDLLRHCERDNEFSDGTWAMPKWGWVNLVLPLFKCLPSGPGPCFQPRQGWTTSYYPGIGILVLALFSSRFTGQRKVALFWGLALAGLLLALGDDGYVYTLLHKALPVSGLMRFPIKFVVLATFAFPLLASFAVAQFRAHQASPGCETTHARRWVITLSTLMTGVIIGALFYAYGHPFGKMSWSTLVQNGALRILCLVFMVGILLRLKNVGNPRVQMALQIALVACVGIDTWTHAPNQNPTVSPDIYAPHVVARELKVPPGSESPRAFITRGTFDVFFHTMLSDPAKDFIGKRFGLLGNCNLLDDVSTPDGFYSLYLSEQRDLWYLLFHATNFPAGLADFLGISRISTNVFEWQTRASARPIMSIGARPVFANPLETVSRLLEPKFDSREVVYLPVDARASLAHTNTSKSRILRSSFSNSQITATTDSAEPAMLVIAQSYYHHWKASIDGEPVKIWRGNHAFQAIEVPAGQREIKLVYQDRPLMYGSLISGSALFGCLAAWFGQRKRSDQTAA